MKYIWEEKPVLDVVGQPIKKGDRVVHLSAWRNDVYISPAKVLHAGNRHEANGCKTVNCVQIMKDDGVNPSFVSNNKLIKISRAYKRR